MPQRCGVGGGHEIRRHVLLLLEQRLERTELLALLCAEFVAQLMCDQVAGLSCRAEHTIECIDTNSCTISMVVV